MNLKVDCVVCQVMLVSHERLSHQMQIIASVAICASREANHSITILVIFMSRRKIHVHIPDLTINEAGDYTIISSNSISATLYLVLTSGSTLSPLDATSLSHSCCWSTVSQSAGTVGDTK